MEKKNSKAKMHIPGTVSTAEAQKMQESMERKWIRIQKKVRHHHLLPIPPFFVVFLFYWKRTKKRRGHDSFTLLAHLFSYNHRHSRFG